MSSGSTGQSALVPQGSTIPLATIDVGRPPPVNDLPGNGSTSAAANGQRFLQIQQDLNRALTANRPSPIQAVQGLNDAMSAQADARATQQQAQFEANMAGAVAQRAASLPPPPAAPVMPVPPPPEPPVPAPAEAGAAGVAVAVPAAAGALEGGLAALPSMGQVLSTAGGLALRGGALAGTVLGLGAGAILGVGKGNIPSEADEAAMRAETEARLRATGALPGPEAAPAPASPDAPAAGEAVPSLPGAFGPVPFFLAAPPAFDAPGLSPTTLPFEAPPPPATLTPPAALAPAPDGGAGALPGFTPAPPVPGLEGLTLPPAFGDLSGLAAPPAGIEVPGFAPTAPTPPLPGFAPVDPALGGPLVVESGQDPGLTRPGRALDGALTGPRSTNVPRTPGTEGGRATLAQKFQVDSENKVADRLVAQGYDVVQNPTVGPNPPLPPERFDEFGLDPDRNPDLLVNGRVFDTYTPVKDDPVSVRRGIQDKIDKKQTHRVVVDLRATTQTAESVRAALRADPVQGLREVLILTKDGLGRAFP